MLPRCLSQSAILVNIDPLMLINNGSHGLWRVQFLPLYTSTLLLVRVSQKMETSMFYKSFDLIRLIFKSDYEREQCYYSFVLNEYIATSLISKVFCVPDTAVVNSGNGVSLMLSFRFGRAQ